VWIKSEKLIDEDGLEYTIDLSGNSQAQQYVEQKMTEYHELQVGPYKRESFTITDWCRKINVPCIKSFPYGHFDSRAVLPLGHTVTLDATNCTVDIIFDE
jgi:hypothetical protein